MLQSMLDQQTELQAILSIRLTTAAGSRVPTMGSWPVAGRPRFLRFATIYVNTKAPLQGEGRDRLSEDRAKIA